MRNGGEVRFWKRIEVCSHVPDRSQPVFYMACSECCWLWQGARNHAGYGRTCYTLLAGEETYAHRVAWAMARQGMNPPSELEVCHACDVPRCCNPSHLFEGTQDDNMKDMVAKGRSHATPSTFQSGSSHRLARLSKDDVRQIRALYVPRKITLNMLANQFNISFQHVSDIVHRKKWTSI